MFDQSVQNSSELLDALLNGRNTTIARDLKLNLKRLLAESALNPQEAGLALLAVATSVEEPALVSYARRRLEKLGFPSEQIQETAESAAYSYAD